MRFIVDFFRYALFGLIGIMIAGLIFICLQLTTQSGWGDDAPEYFFAGGAVLIALFVMSLGFTPTFISIHDRHIELVQELQKLRETMTPVGADDEQ